jgi:hypothetical protein
MTNAVLNPTPQQRRALVMVKLLHTAVWAFLAGCIVALPAAAWLRRFDWAAILTAIILIECAVLGLNGGRCPLTGVAARYTAQDSPNADIYLPAWLAKHNKTLFGTLFAVNELIVLWRWLK